MQHECDHLDGILYPQRIEDMTAFGFQDELVARHARNPALYRWMLTYVPELDLYLDGTAEHSGTTELPTEDQGVTVLLVGPDGEADHSRREAGRFDAELFDRR
mgnify:CR=1 FL=1